MKAMIREIRIATTDNVIADNRPRMPTSYGHTAMADTLRGMGSRAVLEDRAQLRPEPSEFLLLLVKHPLMESPQRQEEQHETEEDEPRKEPADPEDVREYRRRRRSSHRKEEQPDEDEVPEREGERQGSERLQPEECVLVVRAQRERSASETMDAQGDAPERQDDGRERQRRHGQREDVVNGRRELEAGTGASVEHERRRTRAEDRRGVDSDE